MSAPLTLPTVLDAFRFRNIGPTRGGRVVAVAGDPRDPANGGMGGEPGNPPGTGPGPGDPFARCATIETAIVELCNAPPQCGGR